MNAGKIITLQDLKKCRWRHTYAVKTKCQAGNTWVKDIMATARDRINLYILPEYSAGGLGSRTEQAGVTYLWEYTYIVHVP